MEWERLGKEELLELLKRREEDWKRREEEWENERRLLWETICGLRDCVNKDSLTNAATRAVLQTHLRMFDRVAKSDPGTYWGVLALFDLDKFKSYNDTYGHSAGDRLLRFFVEVLRTRFQNCIVYRLSGGGDEFVLTFVGEGEDEARQMAAFVMEYVQNGIPYEDVIIRVSVGVSVVCLDATLDIEGAIQEADQRMYAGKTDSRKGPGRKTGLIGPRE